MKKKMDKPESDAPQKVSLHNTESPAGDKRRVVGSAGRKVTGGAPGGRQQWITDVMIIFLLLSGAILLYHFNKQSERIEQMKRQAVEAPTPSGKKSY